MNRPHIVSPIAALPSRASGAAKNYLPVEGNDAASASQQGEWGFDPAAMAGVG